MGGGRANRRMAKHQDASFGQSVTACLLREVREANSFTERRQPALRVEQVGRLSA